VVMNQKSWDKLPKDVQKVFDELTGDWAVEFTGKAWDKFDAEAVEMNKKKGIEYISLAPEELARWKKVLAPVKQKYAAELDAKGLPGTKVLSEMEKMGKK
jgi:TRAP-type C4-dicarboxylate transport system substrate-binding protein